MQQWRLVQVHVRTVGPEHTTGPVATGQDILVPVEPNRRLTHLN